MAERHDRRTEVEPASADAWRGPFANGAIVAVVATMLLWGPFKEFKPPPEEPESVQQMMDDAHETIRRGREFIEFFREQSRITDALDERIEALEAQRAADPDRAGFDDERGVKKPLVRLGGRAVSGYEFPSREPCERTEQQLHVFNRKGCKPLSIQGGV